ncbi:MAG: acetoacetate decarboxylase family protein [Pseudomonadales bacterium]|nr:acetoacetate decarboxylase family protein [Pseudomonadales bacterium]
MSMGKLAFTLGALFLIPFSTAIADDSGKLIRKETNIIKIADHDVPVVKNGLYDRFRSNPPLSVIRKESPDTDLSWFETLKKQKVDIGFESYSPNFYYENSKVTVVYTADLEKLKELIPVEVLRKVQPLQILPGRGLVALTAYAYHFCDNDSYNEISLSVVTSHPSGLNLGPISLFGQVIAKDMWGYVLKLPVDTDLAMVRGVVGYNLPKWVTSIKYQENSETISFEVIDQKTGEVDFVLETKKLDNLSNKPKYVTNSFTNVDSQGVLTYGYAETRKLSYASNMDCDSVNLKLSDGSFSSFIKSLDLGDMIRYEYIPSFQSALYAPKPLESLFDQN